MPSAFQSYKPRFMKVFGAICVNTSGEVLLVRGRRSKKWSFPKGHCKGQETDLECAVRELKEETSLDLCNEKYTSCHKLRGATYFVFPIEGSPDIKVGDKWEIEEVAWCPLTKLPAFSSNVDVSIFRTLMKNLHKDDKDVLSFIESVQAKKKVVHIKNIMGRLFR